ncbi:MAG: glycosyl hydrolase family 8 [Deltaproteobacteria bacterium]|nr:glycosyl hydrolase family 8 [Deltaproteobacteria bacterium]
MERLKPEFVGSLCRLAGVWLCLWLGLPACGSGDVGDLDRILQASWENYARRYISPEGRVILAERGGESISEAQAYALMRALWAGDEARFAKVYAWTRANLCRLESRGDHLLAWHWGRKPDGTWGVLDWNTASDADLDYALALWLASRRGWRPPPSCPDYASEARAAAQDILNKEVVRLPDRGLLLAPGNWHESAPPFLINSSYFFPPAYRLFAAAGLNGRWQDLHTAAYPFLERLAQSVGSMTGVGLFPDWVRVDAFGNFYPAPDRDTAFGWEAVRLPWRVALDRLWFGDEQAGRLLSQSFLPFFKREWQTKGRLAAVYSYEGRPLADYESPVIYAGVLAAALAAGDRQFADRLAQKILSFYTDKPGEAYFVSPDNYYANNWAWFGLALYAGRVKVF